MCFIPIHRGLAVASRSESAPPPLSNRKSALSNCLYLPWKPPQTTHLLSRLFCPFLSIPSMSVRARPCSSDPRVIPMHIGVHCSLFVFHFLVAPSSSFSSYYLLATCYYLLSARYYLLATIYLLLPYSLFTLFPAANGSNSSNGSNPSSSFFPLSILDCRFSSSRSCSPSSSSYYLLSTCYCPIPSSLTPLCFLFLPTSSLPLSSHCLLSPDS